MTIAKTISYNGRETEVTANHSYNRPYVWAIAVGSDGRERIVEFDGTSFCTHIWKNNKRFGASSRCYNLNTKIYGRDLGPAIIAYFMESSAPEWKSYLEKVQADYDRNGGGLVPMPEKLAEVTAYLEEQLAQDEASDHPEEYHQLVEKHLEGCDLVTLTDNLGATSSFWKDNDGYWFPRYSLQLSTVPVGNTELFIEYLARRVAMGGIKVTYRKSCPAYPSVTPQPRYRVDSFTGGKSDAPHVPGYSFLLEVPLPLDAEALKSATEQESINTVYQDTLRTPVLPEPREPNLIVKRKGNLTKEELVIVSHQGNFIYDPDYNTGYDLDGAHARQYLESKGFVVTKHYDTGRNGLAMTDCGLQLSTNGYISRTLKRRGRCRGCRMINQELNHAEVCQDCAKLAKS